VKDANAVIRARHAAGPAELLLDSETFLKCFERAAVIAKIPEGGASDLRRGNAESVARKRIGEQIAMAAGTWRRTCSAVWRPSVKRAGSVQTRTARHPNDNRSPFDVLTDHAAGCLSSKPSLWSPQLPLCRRSESSFAISDLLLLDGKPNLHIPANWLSRCVSELKCAIADAAVATICGINNTLSRHRFEAYLDKLFDFSRLVRALPEGRTVSPQQPWQKVSMPSFWERHAAAQPAPNPSRVPHRALAKRIGPISDDTSAMPWNVSRRSRSSRSAVKSLAVSNATGFSARIGPEGWSWPLSMASRSVVPSPAAVTNAYHGHYRWAHGGEQRTSRGPSRMS